MPHPIYLDYNGTTPLDPEVIRSIKPFLEREFGNPSSNHWFGIAPKQAVDGARRQVAAILGCAPKDLIFTSGGTESNNHAIKGIAFGLKSKGNHIITTQVEHPAVLEVCAYLENYGFETTYLPVDETGSVSVSNAEAAITDRTILITVMHANNEVGTVQPIEEISKAAKKHGIICHTDAAQSVGKIPADIRNLGVDFLSVAGHKVYAPKGIGALYIGTGIEVEKFCHGAGQEGGRRAGTENVMGIVGLGKACDIAHTHLKDHAAHLENMRNRLETGIRERISDVTVNGHPIRRLPNTLSVSFHGLEANRILEEIGLEIAASAGAACHSDHVDISHVLKAMNIPDSLAKGTIRFSTGRMTTAEEIDRSIEVVAGAIKKLRHKPKTEGKKTP